MNKRLKPLLKNNMPALFRFLKQTYQTTSYCKQRLINEKIYKKSNEDRIENFNRDYMSKVFNDRFVVHNGPFEGMHYIDTSNGSAFLPKILGSYEEPIQDWVEEVIERKYKTIIDIGCAEGYYAVGFAMRMPNTKIIAFDVDENARTNLKKLSKLNHVKNIQINVECTFDELNLISKENTLIFCDIEGFERILLDPLKVSNLKYVDVIVETHDFIFADTTELLISRFYKTHIIKMIVDYPFRVIKYATPNQCSTHNLIAIQNEHRPILMKFLYMKSTHDKL